MHYRKENDDIADTGAPPDPTLSDQDHPRAYLPDAKLVDAVNVALMLERPLLLTGSPGTGKTQVAYSLAWQLASRRALDVTSARVEKFETKSTTVARDLFYTFDLLGRFHANHTGGSTDNLEYITYNALGRALLDCQPWDQIARYVRAADRKEYLGPRRSVVLIDEIDKAPRDFPNDILNEIDQMYFRVPELKAKIGGDDKALKPIVVLTSNSEKALPDPFLRRCVYYNITPPDSDRLTDILLARLKRHGVTEKKLVGDVVTFAMDLETRKVPHRKISAPELLQWLVYMLRRRADPTKALRDRQNLPLAVAGLSTITKDPTDQQLIRTELDPSG
jgi:MoxR-like ATPase